MNEQKKQCDADNLSYLINIDVFAFITLRNKEVDRVLPINATRKYFFKLPQHDKEKVSMGKPKSLSFS